MQKPLHGVRVLDLTQNLAGPYAARSLADLGADVIKLERPDIGDGCRNTHQFKPKKGLDFACRNRGKRFVGMDIKDPRQKEILIKMIKDADIIISNFKAGTMEKNGLSYEEVKAINPKIVYALISGFGNDSPYKHRAVYDIVAQAEAGVVSITGEQGKGGCISGAYVADTCAGMQCAIGVLAALYDAQRTGIGRMIDVAMFDTIADMQEGRVANYFVNGEISKPCGSELPTVALSGAYKCKDGVSFIIAVSTNGQFAKFCKGFGIEYMLEGEEFSSIDNRIKNRVHMRELVQKRLDEINSDEFVEIMETQGLAYGRINNTGEVATHPQMEYRHMWVDAVYPDGDKVKVTASPIKLNDDDEETGIKHMALVGEDTYEVLKDYCDEKTLHEIYGEFLDK